MEKHTNQQIEILDQPLDVWQKLKDCQAALPMATCGALSLFVGSMRDFNRQVKVKNMWLEHYPEMTHSYIANEVAKMCVRFQLDYVYIAHRVGIVRPGDTIVAVAVWAAHRRDAMAANHHLVEQLKAKAPFWKKETLANNEEHWVTANTPGAFSVDKVDG